MTSIHCNNGHEITKDNLYLTPVTMTPTCLTCFQKNKVSAILGAIAA